MAGRVLGYLGWFLLALAAASVALLLVRQRPAPLDASGGLPEKTAFFLASPGGRDLLFLGDSRTYCALHPELLDPLLGTRSLNLSHWAHWLPTQYPQAQDLAAAVPAGTVVLWTIGRQNFGPGEILDKYPIGFSNVPRYLGFGIGLGQMAENLAAFNPGAVLYAMRAALLRRTLDLADRPVRAASDSADPGREAVRELETRFLARPGVARAEVQAPEGRPVAVAQFLRGGGYLLEELDPAHFRLRQQAGIPRKEGLEAPATAVSSPSPSRWALFLAMLDLFRERGVRLVVNVLEEAPHTYAAQPGRLAEERAFMDGPVRREVEARGFAFIRADLDRLTDADYFDYNHLNSRGAEKYAALLAQVLRPHLQPGGRP